MGNDKRDLNTAKRCREVSSECVRGAVLSLRMAQEAITDVEGKGFSELYSELANVAQSMNELAGRIDALQPTGIYKG